MGSDDIYNTCLALGLGFSNHDHQEKKKSINNVTPLKSDRHHYLFPSDLTLGPSSEETITCWSASALRKINDLPQDLQQQKQQASSSPTTTVASSLSNSNSVKKERGFEEVEVERGSSRVISDEDEEGSPRKKLRLTKEQSAVLEDRFKEQTTLNSKQKEVLAEQLNLRQRQVEVWFQNRRARNKLKQTEVDCEELKKCCESLTEENKRLQRELHKLKLVRMNENTAPFYMQLPAATLTLCPCCERTATGSAW